MPPPPSPLPQGEGEKLLFLFSPSPCGRGLGGGPRRHFCPAHHAAIASVSSCENPLAIRSITVAGLVPARNASIATTISPASRPVSTGSGATPPWQPEQLDAPGGGGRGAQHHRQHRDATNPHACARSCCRSGSVRMRLPVAAKIAFSTAGPATAIVGSPTPPQKPPDGAMIVSTFGMSAIRITG